MTFVSKPDRTLLSFDARDTIGLTIASITL